MKYRPQVSIVAALSGFGILLVAAAIVMMILVLGVGLRNTGELVVDKSVLVADSVRRSVDEFLQPLSAQVEYLAKIAEADLIELAWNQEVVHIMTASHAAIPQASAVAFIRPNFQAIVVVRDADGAPLVLEEDWADFEPARRAVAGSRDLDAPAWSRVVFVKENKTNVLVVRMPVYGSKGSTAEGKRTLRGVFVATIDVAVLSKHLGELTQPHLATPFVLLGTEHILAHPQLATREGGYPDGMPTLASFEDPVLHMLWDDSKLADSLPPGIGSTSRGYTLRTVGNDEESQFAIVFREIAGFSEQPWTVGCYFPIEQFEDIYARLRRGVIGGIIVLVLACIFAWYMGRGIGRPLTRLVNASAQLQQNGLDGVAALGGSRLKELDVASKTFDTMVTGLRERAKMRETFGKYVPSELAEAILADDGALRPQIREATVFFSDVVGFSTISEHLPPESLMELLNQYFSLMADPIQRYGGVIHQFQGDAILATFNLPVDNPDHAAQALRAAWEVQERLAEPFTVGEHSLSLKTRIGINTGTVVGGTVGSGSRLGYTVHGDQVNLASRIEQLNKEYGTTILVSEATRNAVKGGFDFEPIGTVKVRGREQLVSLYKPLRQNV